ncbi:MAG: type II toxin-antitoxin system HicB family antitoxin [Candidatus Diapherotrites archaeon]|uniref:Type II toxin-antitoxin system HicB family antitoxin n=1 Tax=Candidatus Iainarchaeum sp. TaxID=3101447 RepID=A0A7J4IQQ2_9ARCH|nr:MAG: hypothetical protein QT03_C0001G0607 [archaeon GW2011_AR10]MBS3059304.1 type II toxin-antitoxin system HicB family antitoxin [Candidatus Diapherotrites archaeon]HIH07762.1 type II toxin-antitoxin system HicB family antitoxin [Candidatus Diapherotrites archaeon]
MRRKAYDFVVLIEQASDGMFIAKVPDIQGCYTQGKTISQVLDRIKEAIQICLEAEEFESPKTTFVAPVRIK